MRYGPVLVTGGAGFIGSNVVAALEERDEEVIVCDRFDNPEKWRNLAKRHPVDVIHPKEMLWRAHRLNVSAVFHMGAISSTLVTDVEALLKDNYTFSRQLWEWATEEDIPFIYASSAATYGDGKQGFSLPGCFDDLEKLRPLSPYAWSKHLFDLYALRESDSRRSPGSWAGVKFFNVYGPNEYHKKLPAAYGLPWSRPPVPQMFHDIKRGGGYAFVANQPASRDFVWVGDAVAMLLWLWDHPARHGIVNCGTGASRTFFELAAPVFEALGLPRLWERKDVSDKFGPAYQAMTKADMSWAEKAGFDHPFLSVEEGVEKYVQDYLMKDDPYR